jgi:hypothetical protein
MAVSVRPHHRFAGALIAAGVVSAASVVNMPTHPTSVDVANTSAITDALGSLGKGVEVLSSLVGIHVDATVSVPFEATLAIIAAAQNPELGPNVLSYLVQRFVNPAVGPPITAYPWETEQTAALVASLFPYPLGASATDIGLINQARFAFADAFNSVLGRLPDPMPGFNAVQAVMNDTALGGTVVAGQLAVRAPLYMVWNAVNYLGNVPVNLEATLEQAIATPGQIPGLISNLVYGLLSPDARVGLLGQLLNNVVDPLTWLPAPIGYGSTTSVGLANQVRDAITNAVNGFLSMLPAPVTPSALPVATAASSQPIYAVDAGKGAVAPDSLPSTSLAAVTLVPAKVAEKSTETAVSMVVATPAAEDVVPATTPTPADTTYPDTGGSIDTTSDSGAGDASAATGDAAKPDNLAAPSHDTDGGAKVRPGKDKPNEDGSTRSSDHETKPAKREPVKAKHAKAEPGGANGDSGTSHQGDEGASGAAA